MKQIVPATGWLLCMLLFFTANVFSQNIRVKGRIMSKNEPLQGVNVMVKGSSKGTMTDARGEYSLEVPSNAVLLISHAGYGAKEISVNGRTTIDVTLEANNEQLDDVIVVGYGTQRKLTSTGAIGTVKGEELIKAPVAGVSNALIGQIAGLQAVQVSGEFGMDAAQIRVRGTATLNPDARGALIIVDGVVRETYNNIDPNEIESVSLLKDASATAVFGVRGANGVLIITTKQGKSGKPQLSVTSNVGLLQPVILPRFVNAYDYAVLRNEAERNMGRTPTFSDEDLALYKSGEDPIFHGSTNWIDELIKKESLQQSHNINMSGGTDKLRYFTSLGYFNQGGAYHKPTTDFGFPFKHSYDRFNIRMNFDFNFTKDFSMSVKLGQQITNNEYPNGGAWGAFDKATNTPPMVGPSFIDGKYVENIQGLPAGVPFFNPWGQAGPTSTGGAFVTDRFANVLNTNLSLRYRLDKITPGLSLRAMGAYDSYYMKEANRSKVFEAYTVVKDPSQPNNYRIFKTKDPGPFTGLSESVTARNKWRKIYAEAGIDYSRTFGDHHVTAMALANAEKGYYPHLEYGLPTAYLGLVSRVTYSYKERYMGEVNVGYNGSENFPEGARYGLFPAFSLGWIASNEPFMEKLSVISFLKIRGSYGQVGQDKVVGRRYMYIQAPFIYGDAGWQDATFGTAGVDQARYNVYTEGALNNPNVRWEVAEKYNIGAEIQFFNGKLSFTGDYFGEKRNNILWFLNTVPELVSAVLQPVNMGRVQNRGYEIELGYKDRIGQLTYQVKGAYSYTQNRINFMDEPTMAHEWMQRTGRPLDQYMGLTFEGFYNSWEEINDPKRPKSEWEGSGLQPGDMKYKDLNNDGLINTEDVGPIGHSNWPAITYSASLALSWKGFDMSVLVQGTDRVSVYYTASGVLPFGNNWGPAHEWNLERWNPERYANGEKITFPRLELAPGQQHNYRVSDFWVQNGAYVRLKNVEMGYRFASGFLDRFGIRSLRLFASGNNLYTWSKMKYRVDPDARETWGRVYPPMRVFNMGINLQF